MTIQRWNTNLQNGLSLFHLNPCNSERTSIGGVQPTMSRTNRSKKAKVPVRLIHM